MGLLQTLGFGTSTSTSDIPNIYPFPVPENDFIQKHVTNLYSRILTDVLERTEGIPEAQQNLFWDNCDKSESQDGLVTLLAKAMVAKGELYIVYEKDIALIRKAKATEEAEIKADYAARNKSAKGVYITFKNYDRTDFLKIYSALEYAAIVAFHKNLNISKAIQIKINDLRGSTGLSDSEDVKAQGTAVAEALAEGGDVMIDAKDLIEMLKVDVDPAKAADEFITKKRTFYLGLPVSWLNGELNGGLGDTGAADQKAVERGLKGYFFPIIKPTIEKIFNITKVSFKSEDSDLIKSGLEVFKTMEVTTNELVSLESKQKIVNKALGLPPEAKGDPVEAVPVNSNGTDPKNLIPPKGQPPVAK